MSVISSPDTTSQPSVATQTTYTLWICPQPECGNYYGTSSAGDLRKQFNQDSKAQVTFPRTRCPDCTRRGIVSERVPVQVVQKAHIRVMDLPDYSMEGVSKSDVRNGNANVLSQRHPAPANGNYCVLCGGQMVQTGTCETCMACGNTTGCG